MDQETIEQIRNMLPKPLHYTTEWEEGHQVGYNNALDDVVALLESKQKDGEPSSLAG